MPTAAQDLTVDEKTAATLAAGEAVVLDGWLGHGRAQALRQEVVDLVGGEHFRAAGVGRGEQHVVAPKVRGDSVCWFDPDGVDGLRPGAQVALFLARLDGLVQHLNATCFLGLQRVECHAACFEPGAFYAAHKDTFAHDTRRVLSFCYYLNDSWTEAAGGCLRLHRDPVVDVAPLLDRLVVFRSADVLHQVLPTTVRRLSLTGWLSKAPPPRT